MTNRKEAIEKLTAIIEDVHTAMLTTIREDGDLHSRPMYTEEHHFDGDVWFFAKHDASVVKDIQREKRVNVSYASNGNYASIAGYADIVTDVEKKESLWHADLAVWYEDGPTSPEVVLIHVDAQSAQYWDDASTAIGQAINMAKVVLTGDQTAAGDSREINFNR